MWVAVTAPAFQGLCLWGCVLLQSPLHPSVHPCPSLRIVPGRGSLCLIHLCVSSGNYNAWLLGWGQLLNPYHWMKNWMFYRIVCSDIIKGTVYFLFHTNSLSVVAQGLEIKNKKTEILSQKLLFLFCKGKDVRLFILSTSIYWLPPRGHYCPRSKTDTPLH